MANTYSGDPATSDKDWVRFRIGDTGPDDWIFSDEEILATLAETGDRRAAAVALLVNIAVRMAQRPDFRIGRFSESYKDAIAALNAKAKEIAEGSNLGFWAGGISVSDKTTREADSDRVAPSFKRGMMRP